MELYRKYSSEQWGRWISELGDEGHYGWTKKEWSDWRFQMDECIPGAMAEKRRREERKAAAKMSKRLRNAPLQGEVISAAGDVNVDVYFEYDENGNLLHHILSWTLQKVEGEIVEATTPVGDKVRLTGVRHPILIKTLGRVLNRKLLGYRNEGGFGGRGRLAIITAGSGDIENMRIARPTETVHQYCKDMKFKFITGS